MSVNPATNHNNGNKRVRIQSTNTNITTETGTMSRVKTPKALALACVQSHVASLHPQVHKIINIYGVQFIEIYHKIQQKSAQLSKMETNDTFIPRSARINFEFHVRPEVEQSSDFTTIKSSTTELIKDFQQNLKSKIMETMRLDISYLQNKLNSTVCELVFYTSKAFHLLHNPTQINPPVTKTVALIINGFGDNLLKHCSVDKTSFKALFVELFNDTSINQPHTIQIQAQSQNYVSNASNPRNPYARQLSQLAATQENNESFQHTMSTVIPPFFDHLRSILEKTLVTSVDKYIDQVNANKAASQLEAFSTELLHEKSTADTAAQMDLSPSVTPQELEELIAKSTKKAVSDLSREIQSLKARLTNADKNNGTKKKNTNNNNSSTKNFSKRGRKGASSKNKSNYRNRSRSRFPRTNKRSQSTSTQTNRRNPDAKNNDSTKNHRKKHSNTNKNNWHRKRSPSNSKSRRG